MSASREKKKRQESISSGAVDPKAVRAAEEKAAMRKTNILYGTIFGVFALVAVALLVYNSGILQRNQTAVTIDGEKYSVPQAAYYYQQAYQSFLNSQTGQLYTAIGALNTSASLKSQNYSETQTWDDFFKEQAVQNMRFVHAAKAAAAQDGVTLDGEELEAYQESIESFKTAASQAGYSYKSYLTAVYGSTMTPSVFESCMKDSYLVSKYSGDYSEENFVFTDDDIQKYYEENQNNYDLVDGAYVSISGAAPSTTDDEGNTVEATDEEKAAAMEQARETAAAILSGYKEGGDLEALADEHGAVYVANDAFTYSSSTYGEWLFDSARRSGDVEQLEDGSSCYVVLFNSRERDEALDYNVRHVLVTEENLELAEGEEATTEMIEAKAQEILDSWDGTEDGFAALANEHSQDPGSNTTGGLYEDVAKGTMVTAFQNWCYEDGRKAGDTGIVTSSAGTHIMYFVGYGDTEYWHYACENMLISDAANAWQESLIESVAAETDEGGMNLIG